MNTWQHFLIAREHFELDPASHRESTLEAARASLAAPANQNNHNTIGEWMLEKFGTEAIPDLVNHFAVPQEHVHFKIESLPRQCDCSSPRLCRSLQAAVKTNESDLALSTLPHLIAIRDDSQDGLIAPGNRKRVQR